MSWSRTVLMFFTVIGIVGSGILLGRWTAGRYVIDSIVVQAAQKQEKEEPKDNDDRYKNLELFQKVLHYVESNYVDELGNKELMYGALKGMMQTLDPHSNFLPEKIFRDMKIDTAGKFGGLGIEIGMRDNVLTVISPIEDTPAWKAGLKPGDRIVKINDESTKGLTLSEAVAEMRGKRGSKVKIAIFRDGFEKIKEITIVREEIKLRSVKSESLEPGFLYVRLTNFNEDATRDMKRAIANAENKGKKLEGLIFDLRTNPGGLLDQAVEVASLFIDEGVIVSTIGRNRDRKEIKHAKRGKARKDFSIAVLVNSSTASAAEIVAGALQDHKRAVILGQPTFGKGSVQQVIELGQNVGLKLTVSRYYTPNGRSIQEKGVVPDIMLDEYDPALLAKALIKNEALRERDLPGHIKGEAARSEFSPEELRALGKADIEPVDSKSEELKPMKYNPKEDFQVKEALNYLKSFELFKKIQKHAKRQEDAPDYYAKKSGAVDSDGQDRRTSSF